MSCPPSAPSGPGTSCRACQRFALEFGGRPRVGNSTLNLARVGVRDFMTKLVAAGEAIKDLHADTLHRRDRLRKPAFMKGTERINLDYAAPTVTLSSTDELRRTPQRSTTGRRPSRCPSASQVGVHGTYLAHPTPRRFSRPAASIAPLVRRPTTTTVSTKTAPTPRRLSFPVATPKATGSIEMAWRFRSPPARSSRTTPSPSTR